jgi:hypothetical protein
MSTRIYVRCWAAGLVATVLQACPDNADMNSSIRTLGGGDLYSVNMKLVQSDIQTAELPED